MIDTCYGFSSSFQFIFHSQFFQQSFRTYLYTVAKTYCSNLGITLHISGEHGHRIGIIQKQSIGTNFFHIPCKLFQNRNGSKGSHDTADSQCISYRLTKAVFFRYFKICYCTGFIATDLDSIHNKIRIPQSIFSVFLAQISRNLCSSFIYISIDSAQDNF